MKHIIKLTVVLGALSLWAGSGVLHAGEPREHAKKRYYSRGPLVVNIQARRRRGGYSYGVLETTSSPRHSPPPYAEVHQTPGGPFDYGFFFDSGTGLPGLGLHGGNSPYQH
jgi:hypothetical protein